MDCPHVKKCSQRVPPMQQIPFQCADCSSKDNPWMCLTCCGVFCGRYINAHAKSHNEKMKHPVTIDVHNLGVYCYECDDFVDIKLVKDRTLQRLQSLSRRSTEGSLPGGQQSKQENENTEPAPIRASKRRSATAGANGGTSGSSSGNEEAKANDDEDSTKRRRESTGTNGIVRKQGVVGLRNLGNTCFMNAVLQSLSKINGFSTYMQKIPEESLEVPLEPRHYRTRSRLRPNQTLNASSQQSGKGSTSSTGNNNNVNENTIVIQPDEILTTELSKVLGLLNSKTSATAVSPDALFSIIWSVIPRFRGYQQQDVHEFLRYMLDRLHTELVRLLPHWQSGFISHLKKTERTRAESALDFLEDGLLDELKASTAEMHNSIVTTVFSGLLQNEVRCCACGTESKKYDPFLDLSLDIANGEPRLEDCLSRFVDVEELVDNDMYFCSKCNSRRKSTKRFWIKKLPNVLCLHLKRFRWSNYLRSKLDHFVEFPLESLDMTNYVLSPNGTRKSTTSSSSNNSTSNLYDLAAVIVHHGTGVGSGHYTAFAKKDSEWFNFNDSSVKQTQESIVAKAKAYILFYIRREFHL